MHKPLMWMSLSEWGAWQAASFHPWSVHERIFPLFPNIPFPQIWSMIIGRMSTNRHFVFHLLFFKKATKTEVTSDLSVSQIYRAVSIIGYVDSVWLRGTGRFWKDTSHFFSEQLFFFGFWLPFFPSESTCFGAWICHLVSPVETGLLSFLPSVTLLQSSKKLFIFYVKNPSLWQDNFLTQLLE